jgi:HAD superfamily hydrolase (TIGR01509 family)
VIVWPLDGRPLRAAVFDLDGLLIDSEPAQMEAWRETLLSLGIPPLDLTDWVSHMGRRVIDTAGEFVQRFGLSWSPDDLVRARETFLLRLVRARAKPISASRETVLWLRERGLKLGLATSGHGHYVDLCLDLLGLADIFDVIVTGDAVERGKPDPEIYSTAISALQVEASEAVALEDSPVGAEAARRAGLRVVVVPNSYTSGAAFDADAVFDNLGEFVRWLSERRWPNGKD